MFPAALFFGGEGVRPPTPRRPEPLFGRPAAASRRIDVRGGGRHHDPVEGSPLEALVARSVGPQDGHVVPELGEDFFRLLSEAPDPFDARDLRPHGGQDRGLIARTRPDLQDLLPFGRHEKLRHPRHHVGLGDGLVLPDGQGAVDPGAFAQTMRKKEMTGHRAHGGEDRLGPYAPRNNLLTDHRLRRRRP